MKNKKLIGLGLMLIALVLMYVGTYAYYMKVVNGTITGKTGAFTFDVLHNDKTFTTIDLYDTMENPSLTSKYIIPGDSGKFELTADATGSLMGVEYEITFTGTNIPTNMKFYLDENKTKEIKMESGLSGYIKSDAETKTRVYTIYWDWPYDSGENNDDDIKYENKDMVFDVTAIGKQSSGFAMMMNDATTWNGRADAKGIWNSSYQGNIKSITFSNDLTNLPSSCTAENLCWDISDENSSYPVYNYLKTNEDGGYDAYIVSEKEIYAPYDCTNLFSMTSTSSGPATSLLKSINFGNVFNTSKVTNMSNMFAYCTTLLELDLSNFDTTNVVNMESMFEGCADLKTIDVSSFNTSKVTDMSDMFSAYANQRMNYSFYSSLTEIKFGSNFDTSKVTDMGSMFRNCEVLRTLDLSSFNTSNVTDMSGMFDGCTTITTLNISNFNTSNVTTMQDMFSRCSSLTSLNLNSFDTSNVRIMLGMFSDCSSLTSLNLSNFNTSNITNYGQYKNEWGNYTGNGMFSGCTKLTTTLTIRNASSGYEGMFYNAATASNAKITVNYTTSTESLVDKMIATKPSNSNIVKGSLVS